MPLRVEHLSKTIGKTEILHDISFEISGNGVVGLLGPNGAGKSTLMKLLAGVWHSERCASLVLPEVTDGKRSAIGYLPENNPLYEDMYVREYLRFMLSLTVKCGKTEAQQRVQQLIESVRLTPMAHKKLRELSKGYRQRVGLAQAIAGDPALLILDEPTTGLDPNQLDEIRALIRRLGSDRIVLLSTHILQEVQAMCNRVIILSNGSIQADTTDLTDLENLFREKTKL